MSSSSTRSGNKMAISISLSGQVRSSAYLPYRYTAATSRSREKNAFRASTAVTPPSYYEIADFGLWIADRNADRIKPQSLIHNAQCSLPRFHVSAREDLSDGRQQLHGVEGFGENAVGAGLLGARQHLWSAETGNQHHPDRRMRRLGALQHLQSGDSRHADVGDHQGEGLPGQQGDGVFAVGGGADAVAGAAQHEGATVANGLLLVDHKDAGGGGLRLGRLD